MLLCRMCIDKKLPPYTYKKMILSLNSVKSARVKLSI